MGSGASASTVSRSTAQKNPPAQTAKALGAVIPFGVVVAIVVLVISLVSSETESTSEVTEALVTEHEEYGEYEVPEEYRFEVDVDEATLDHWRYDRLREVGFEKTYIMAQDLEELQSLVPVSRLITKSTCWKKQGRACVVTQLDLFSL